MRWVGVAGLALAVGLTGLLASRTAQAQDGRKSAYVELTNPQSDDLGRCIEPDPKGFQNRVTGCVSARAETKAVSVNGTPTRLYRRANPVLGAPAGWPRCAFEAWLPQPVPDQLTVVVTAGTGRVAEARFVRDTNATMSRLRELATNAPHDAMSHCRIGSALFERDKAAQAGDEYRRAVELDPDNPGAHSGLGHVLWSGTTVDEAIAELETAIRLDPKAADSHMLLGIGLFIQGDPTKGMAEIRKAEALEPASPTPHWAMGLILHAEGKPKEAIAEHRKAIDLEPNFAEARVLLASLLNERDELEEAVVQSRKALDINPQVPGARVELARALYLQQKTDDGVAECEKAIEEQPENPEAHAVMAGLLIDQKKVDESIAEARKALELDPGNAWAYGSLACALYHKGRYVEAERMMAVANYLGISIGDELEEDIRDKARLMRSWMMDGRLTMAAMFLPLIGVLAALGVGSIRAGGLELVPRALAWRVVLPMAVILTISLVVLFVAQVLFKVGQIGIAAYGYATHIMVIAAIFGAVSLLALLCTIPGRPSKAAKGPGGVPYFCAECRQTINFWRMYYDGRKTTCANCLAAAGALPVPAPSQPPPPPPPSQLPPPVPPAAP